jgi:ABC-type xylose transport system substrate-binding protein
MIFILFTNLHAEDISGEDKFVVGVSFFNAEIDYKKKLFEQFIEYGTKLGLKILAESAHDSFDRETGNVERFIDLGVDCIILYTYNENPALAPLIEKAMNKGIKTIRYDNVYNFLPVDVILKIDYREIGKMQGEWAIKQKPCSKIVILAGNPEDLVATELYEAQMEVLSRGLKKGSYKILFTEWSANWDPSMAEQALISHPEWIKADVILASNDLIAGKVVEMMKKRGLKIPVCGMDGMLQNCRYVADGSQSMTVIKDPNDMIADAFKIVQKIKNGEFESYIKGITEFYEYDEGKVPCHYTNSVAITKENLSELILRKWYTQDELFKK